MRVLLAPLLAVTVLTACSGSDGPAPRAVGPTTDASTPVTPIPSTSVLGASLTRPSKVLVVVEENHSATSALKGMPNLAALARRYGYTTAYKAIRHPSLPNYLALAGGSTFGVTDDKSPASHHLSGQSVFDRAIASGKTAKSYVEAMPTACGQSATTKYAVKHNPWAYFSDATSRANCRRSDVASGTTSAGALRSDIDAGRLPNVGMLVPDICHDGHDCSLATADAWLKPWLSRLMAGPDYRAGRLAIVVTFDEDDYSQSNTVLTVVISPYTSAVTSATAFTHYSLARYLSEIVGATPLRNAATARSLRTTFHI
ncbi:MAG: phosphatidylinositol-3-phosphatase [Frankiaceae bacterium]|nr:phosphatidylinositol-3-phosphatase [Frankiaceae bacterium]